MKSELTMLASKKAGFLKRDVCVLNFFKDEVIVTTVTKEKQKELFDAKKNEVKSDGGGIVKQTIAMQSALPEYVTMLKGLEKEQLKKLNSAAIAKASITKIKFVKASNNTDLDTGTSSQTQGKLVLHVNDEKLKFNHVYEDRTKEMKIYFKGYIG